MDKLPADISNSASSTSPAESRTLRDVVYNSKRSGGNYGSLAKSQIQPTYYVQHKVEPGDTLQRLALKYSINIQEIKRVNKIWSDAELGLRENIYIPVNPTQLSTIRAQYPNLEVVQSLPSSGKTATDAESATSIPSSDSSTSIQPTTTTSTNSTYQDYLSKMDQKIQSTKNSLQSLDIKDTYPNRPSTDNPTGSPRNNERHKGVHHSSDNSVFVNISTNNSRDKHVTAALKRIQQEQDNSDEL